jgi:hypothetical protein
MNSRKENNSFYILRETDEGKFFESRVELVHEKDE